MLVSLHRLFVAGALIGLGARSAFRTAPVRDALATGRSVPAALAHAGVRLVAEAVVGVAALAADGLVAEVASPSGMALTGVWLTLSKRKIFENWST